MLTRTGLHTTKSTVDDALRSTKYILYVSSIKGHMYICLGSKELCIPLFSLPGERVCERAYFPDTSDIPTIQLDVVLCVFLSFC